MADDESEMSFIQLDSSLTALDHGDVFITPRSRDNDYVTDNNVADWILDHSDVTSGRQLNSCQAARCYRRVPQIRNVRITLFI